MDPASSSLPSPPIHHPQDYTNTNAGPDPRNTLSRNDSDSRHTPTLYIPIAAPLTPLPSPKPATALQLPLSSSSSSSLGSVSGSNSGLSSTWTSASGAGAGGDVYGSLQLPPAHLNLPIPQQQFTLTDALQLFASTPASTSSSSQSPTSRRDFLAALLPLLTPAETLFLSQRLAPLLKRDFLADLPAELGLLILSFVGAPGGGGGGGGSAGDGDASSGAHHNHTGFSSSNGGNGHGHGRKDTQEPDVRSLVNAGMVSRRWRVLARDETVWRGMCLEAGFGREVGRAQVQAQAQAQTRSKSKSRMEGRSGQRSAKGKGKGKARAPGLQHSVSATSTASTISASLASSSHISTSTSTSTTRSSSPSPTPTHADDWDVNDSNFNEYEDQRQALSASTNTIVPRRTASLIPSSSSHSQSSMPAFALSPSPSPSPDESPPPPPLPILSNQHDSNTHSPSSDSPQSSPPFSFSYRRHFRASWRILTAWRRGGALLAQHRLDAAGGTSLGTTITNGGGALSSPAAGGPANQGNASPGLAPTPTSANASAAGGGAQPASTQPNNTTSGSGSSAAATVTSLALDASLVVVGLASSRVLLFSARSGVLVRTLRGHESGVWSVGLVSAPVGDSREGDCDSQSEGRDGSAGEGMEEWGSERQRKRRKVGGMGERERKERRMEAPAEAQAWGLPDAMRRAVGVPVRRRGGEEGLVLPGSGSYGGGASREREKAPVAGEYSDYNDPFEDICEDKDEDGIGVGVDDDDTEDSAAADRAYARARRVEAAQQPFDHTYSMPGWGPASYDVPVLESAGAGEGAVDCSVSDEDEENTEDGDRNRNREKRKQGSGKVKTVKRGALVVSGGCDKVVKVWDAGSGQCIYTLAGHTATVRALRLVPPVPGFSPYATSPSPTTNNVTAVPPRLDSRSAPLAVTGARDATIRVWDIRLGYCVRVLAGHTGSVRCLDVWCGVGEEVLPNDDTPDSNTPSSRTTTTTPKKLTRRVRQRRCVSGSYDGTCRLWDIDTGECIHVLRGHFSQIYSVAFDGVRIASGGLDTTVRVWDADSGQCVALLQGHTALVCQLQLFRVPNASAHLYPPSPLPGSSSSASMAASEEQMETEYTTILATGGSDGRVITFSLSTYTALHRIAAHDSSVTAMQLGGRFLVTAGNDGRVRLYEARGGGPPSYGRRDSAETLHPQQQHQGATTPTSTSPSPDTTSTTPETNSGYTISSMHDQRAKDAERGARLGVYRYVRDLSSAGETVWKAAFGRDTLVLAGRKGGRGVVEVWTMDPRNRMVRLRGKVKDRDL